MMTVFEAFNGYKSDTYEVEGLIVKAYPKPKLESTDLAIEIKLEYHGRPISKSHYIYGVESDTSIDQALCNLLLWVKENKERLEELANLPLQDKATTGVMVECPQCNSVNWLDEDDFTVTLNDFICDEGSGEEIWAYVSISHDEGIKVDCKSCNKPFLSRFKSLSL
jgi:hypothetical protein